MTEAVLNAPMKLSMPVTQANWPLRKKYVTLANDLTLAYVELGRASAPPLLLVHGYTDNSRSWSLMAPHLAAKHRLIIVDLRGHGASAAPEHGYTLGQMADDLLLLLDKLQVPRVGFVGHSLGSMIGQVFAQRYPDRLDKLVLIGSAASAAEACAAGSWLWENVQALRDPIDPDSRFIREWTSNPNPVDEEFIDNERREACAVPARVWRALVQELGTSDFGRRSPDINTPTLIIWGERDPFFDAAAQTILCNTIPHAQFVTFAKLGHNLIWEDPAGVAAAVARFLR